MEIRTQTLSCLRILHFRITRRKKHEHFDEAKIQSSYFNISAIFVYDCSTEINNWYVAVKPSKTTWKIKKSGPCIVIQRFSRVNLFSCQEMSGIFKLTENKWTIFNHKLKIQTNNLLYRQNAVVYFIHESNIVFISYYFSHLN